MIDGTSRHKEVTVGHKHRLATTASHWLVVQQFALYAGSILHHSSDWQAPQQ
jgi:hypothetical protein